MRVGNVELTPIQNCAMEFLFKSGEFLMAPRFDGVTIHEWQGLVGMGFIEVAFHADSASCRITESGREFYRNYREKNK